MKYEKALEQVVKEGAIRLWRVSGGWQIAYRLNEGQLEARGLHLLATGWELAARLVSSKTYAGGEGWHEVYAMHQRAAPIISKHAESNPGYFRGLTRQCHTCKKYRPISMFNRDMTAERGFRSWECDKCAQERSQEIEGYQDHVREHVGDYMQRGGYASRPPVEGEI